MKRRSKIMIGAGAALLACALAFCPDKKETIDNKVEKPAVALPENRQKAEVLIRILQGAELKQKEVQIPNYVFGCTDRQAFNFDPQATADDSSCDYPDEDLPKCFQVCENPKLRTFREWYSEGQIKKEWSEVCEIKHGDYITWHPDGQKQFELTLFCNSGEGPITEWDLDGTRRYGHLKDGVLDGKVTVYDSKNNLISELNYIDGKKEGLVIDYYPNGTKKQEIPYTDNQKEGQEKKWYPNGQLASTFNYSEDMKEGEMIEYYPNSVISQRRNFKNDQLFGWSYFYDDDGTLNSRAYYYE